MASCTISSPPLHSIPYTHRLHNPLGMLLGYLKEPQRRAIGIALPLPLPRTILAELRLLTTEEPVVEKKEEKPAMPAGGPGGGMGWMCRGRCARAQAGGSKRAVGQRRPPVLSCFVQGQPHRSPSRDIGMHAQLPLPTENSGRFTALGRMELPPGAVETPRRRSIDP